MKKLFESLNRDKTYLLSLLQSNYSLTFDSKICVQTDSIHLWEKNGAWWVKNFNPAQNTQLPEIANFEGLVFDLTNHITNGTERIKQQQQIIAACNGLILPPASVPTHNSTTPHKTTPTNSSPTKQPLEVSFCGWDTNCGVLTKQYFENKAGVTVGTLDRYTVKPLKTHTIKGKTQKYGGTFFGFGWGVGGWTKIKRPTLAKNIQYMQKKGENPYIFGWEQLPTQGKDLVICAGETDCLCINEHCNSVGVFAICLNTENDKKTITSELAKELKRRFKRVFVLYDADNAGISNSRELAQNFGFIWVNIAVYLGNEKDKDVCNIYANKGALGVVEFIQHATNFHTNIKAVPTDIHSIEVPFVYRLEFTQYLGEKQPLETIKSLLICESRLAIQSPAGTGKSTMIQALCSPENNGKNFVCNSLKIDKTIVATPTTAIALQLQKDFEKRGVSCSILYGEISGYNLEISRLDSLVITTYDSLEKLTEFIPSSLLIIDEFLSLIHISEPTRPY